MVTIIGYALRENKEGKSFVSLQLQGDVIMVQSQETGRYYATAKTCSIPSTFNETTADALIGKPLPGRIEKVDSEPYEFTIEETGEVITLQHRWEYLPEDAPAPLRVVHKNVAA